MDVWIRELEASKPRREGVPLKLTPRTVIRVFHILNIYPEQWTFYPKLVSYFYSPLRHSIVNLNFSHKAYYYSLKIFPCFWLVKITSIIHHNQLLLTKFGKKTVIFNQWRQHDVKSTAHCRLLTLSLRKPGHEVVLLLVSKKTKSEIKNGEIFWMNNKAIIEFGSRRIYEEFCRSRRKSFTSAFALSELPLLDLQNSSYPTQAHSVIINYSPLLGKCPPLSPTLRWIIV